MHAVGTSHRRRRWRRGCAVLLFAAAIAAAPAATPGLAQEADGGAWIDTWSSSPKPDWDDDPPSVSPRLRDQSIRQVARVSLGGGGCG